MGASGNEMLPIGDTIPDPTTRVGRQEERRWENVTPEATTGNNRPVSKPPPPEPSLRESRPETPGSVEYNQRGGLSESREDSTTNTQKGAGEDTNGSQKGQGNDKGKEPTARKVHMPNYGKREIRGKVYHAKAFPEEQ